MVAPMPATQQVLPRLPPLRHLPLPPRLPHLPHLPQLPRRQFHTSVSCPTWTHLDHCTLMSWTRTSLMALSSRLAASPISRRCLIESPSNQRSSREVTPRYIQSKE